MFASYSAQLHEHEVDDHPSNSNDDKGEVKKKDATVGEVETIVENSKSDGDLDASARLSLESRHSALNPVALLRSSKLLNLSVSVNRVDAINTILSPLEADQRSFLLDPSQESPPFSILHDPATSTMTDPETGEPLSTLPPDPPLLIACRAGSVEAASALLNFGASPLSVTSLQSLKPMILKQSFGGEIVRILGRDDAERFLLFLNSGFGTRELAMVLVPGFGVGGGDNGGEDGVKEFIKNIQASECLKVFEMQLKKEMEGAGGEGVCRVAGWRSIVIPPGPYNELHEVQLLESTLKSTYNDMLTEVGIISELIKGGARGLVENVKCIKGEMDECDLEFGREMDILEGLLERFDRHIDDEARIDDITSERLIDFRYTVIERNGELVSFDVTEQECREKVENMMRFSKDDALDVKLVMEGLVEDGWRKVKGIKTEIENLALEIASQDEGLGRTGLKGALKHYRSLRDEARLMVERNRMIRIHQQRLERELELLDVGFYDRSDQARGGGLRRRNDGYHLTSQHDLPSPDVLPPTAVIREGLSSHNKEEPRAQENGNGGESIWQIILRLFLGYEFDEEEEGTIDQNEKRRNLKLGKGGTEGEEPRKDIVKQGDVLIV
mmetsp:Transcript_14672/g.30150  ORF Transcript_14672/g.30150 Transcript_14672/m.30150 type:complete len:614 (+) Transcript_14672:35-1876(+)